MEEIYNIIMALIEHIPCFALMFVTHEICKCIQGIKKYKDELPRLDTFQIIKRRIGSVTTQKPKSDFLYYRFASYNFLLHIIIFYILN